MQFSTNANNALNSNQNVSPFQLGVSHHVRQKTPVRIYNSNINKFEYEVTTTYKRNQNAELNSIHTQSDVSVKSMVIHNDGKYNDQTYNIDIIS